MEDAKFSVKQKDREYLSDPQQPLLQGAPPRVKEDSKNYGGVRYFAPHLPKLGRVQILGVGVAPTPEEATGLIEASHSVEIPVKPRLLKGPLHSLIGDSLNRFGHLFSDRFAYTTLIPWLLPKNRRYKPKKEEVEWAAPLMHSWIEELKPECIVAFGKVAFDQLCSCKISAEDARGGWFTYKDTKIPLYLMDPVAVYLTQPWTMDQLLTDFREVNRFLGGGRGMMDEHIEENYRVISNLDELRNMVRYWEENNITRFSVDCEWAGTQYIDGRLRSIQFCWASGQACYLQFFDEHGNYYLGKEIVSTDTPLEVTIHPNQTATPGEAYTDYRAVGRILGRWLNRPEVRYMGHYFAVDSLWMERWLGLIVLGRCEFDLGFAVQTTNEYSKLGLDYLAMKYTSFGRYDMDLVLWKRTAKMKEADGYGKVPDSILIPYACRDVDTVWRCYEPVMQELERQGLVEYYRNYVLPFVSDTFHTFTTTGLKVNMHLFDLTRKFFNWAYQALLEDFRITLTKQADEQVSRFLKMPLVAIQALSKIRDGGDSPKALSLLDSMALKLPEDQQANWKHCREHWANVRTFNIRSAPQMRNWLFNVLGLTPVKTTKNAENGMPSMLWEKVLELPPKLQATLQPAVDKETIEILSEVDTTGSLLRLLAVSNVGNQCKGFLKEGEYDAAGELVEENGLAKFICSDSYIRGNFALTETSRSRSFRPNVLNLSKSHNKGVMNGIVRILENADNNPAFRLPPEFDDIFGTFEQRQGKSAKDLVKKQLPSIRSTVCAEEGWCFVESDYKTAEIRGQAFISGDIDLIRLMVGTDDMFAYVEKEDKDHLVRLGYRDDSGIDPQNRDPELLMVLRSNGETVRRVTPEELLRDGDGKLIHPGYDLHWSLAEMVKGQPREHLKEADRDAAKVGNFSAAYGAVGATLERRIEAQTGKKPPEGTGQALLDALAKRQPVATEFLDEVATKPKTGTELRAASGRIRHFPIHSSDLQGMPWRVRNSYLRAMGNEARNFYMQESVAATAARACKWLNGFFRQHGMRARTAISLYDAILTYCPLEERFVVEKAHQVFMCDINVWQYHGRYMNYPVDTDLVYRWSWKPTPDEKEKLEDRTYYKMDEEKEAYLIDALAKVKNTFFALQPRILPRLNVI